MPSLSFPRACAAVCSPPAPEPDRRENTVPLGKDPGPGPGVQVVRDLLGPMLRNRFALGPLGSIGVNPGQYREESTRLGSSLAATFAAISAAWKSAGLLSR